jgi:hypothetical protein
MHPGIQMPDPTPNVIFHAACPDGRTAAWVISRALGTAIAFHPHAHGTEPPTLDPAGDVWIVDIAFDLAQLQTWAGSHRRVLVLDHHLTAAERLSAVNEPLDVTLARATDPNWRGLSVSLDMDRSGAGLAAVASRTLAPRLDIPEFVFDIEDRDLWRWARPHSREVCAAFDELTTPGTTTEGLDAVALLSRDDLIAIGAPAVAALDESVEQTSLRATIVEIAGWQVPLAQVPEKRIGSFVGARLLQLHPDAPFTGYWLADPETGLLQVGLRSTDERLDVAHVAERFGGGGHRNSAGLSCRTLGELARG